MVTSLIHFVLSSQILTTIACIGVVCGLAQIFSQGKILSFQMPLLQVGFRSLLVVGFVLCFFVDVPAMTGFGSLIASILHVLIGFVVLVGLMYVVQLIGSLILGILSWVFEDLI